MINEELKKIVGAENVLTETEILKGIFQRLQSR